MYVNGDGKYILGMPMKINLFLLKKREIYFNTFAFANKSLMIRENNVFQLERMSHISVP